MNWPSRGTLVGVAMVLAVAVWQGSKYLPARESPFRLWVLAAGRTFTELDDEANQGMRRRFSCKAFELRGAGRFCTLETDGPPGTLSLIVDSVGRAVVVAFRSPEQGAMLRDEIRKVMAQWNEASAPSQLTYVDAQGIEFDATQWLSRNGRWSATIHLKSNDKKTETSVSLRDERALSTIYAAEPQAQLMYAAERLINPLRPEEQLRLAGLIVAARDRGASDSTAGTSENAAAVADADRARRSDELSARARGLPACAPAQTDIAGRLPAARHDWPLTADEMSRAVQMALRGKRLVFERERFLVDESGRAELVRVSAALVDTAARVAAFGITYPRRVQRLSDKSAPTCRALAQLLILKLGADRDILDARVMFVSPDAVASEIVDLGWYHRDHPTLDQVIKVRSRAFYGSPTWFAEIDWEEVVEPESLAHIAAAPVTAAKAEFGGRAVAGQFTQPEVSEDAVQLTLAGMLQPGNTPFSHTFSVPRSGGVLSGWSILLSF